MCICSKSHKGTVFRHGFIKKKRKKEKSPLAWWDLALAPVSYMTLDKLLTLFHSSLHFLPRNKSELNWSFPVHSFDKYLLSTLLNGKEPACQRRRCRLDPWVRKIPSRRKRQPTPVFLPGKSHGQRSLVGYSPWCRKRVGHSCAAHIMLFIHLGLVWCWRRLLRVP